MTQRPKAQRSRWARRHHRLTQAEWGWVLFMDENRFGLNENDCRTRAYRQGERLNDENVAERDRHGSGSVMVWASVSLHQKINIVLINGNLTAGRYQNEMLETEVIPMFRNNRGLKLLQDGAPAHTAGKTASQQHQHLPGLSGTIPGLKLL